MTMGGQPGAQRFAGTRVLVTGAAQGLGAAIASAFAGQGADVALADRSPSVVQQATRIDPAGERTLALQFDVSDEAAFESAFAQAIARFGTIDVLVNCAGITEQGSPWDIPMERWDAVMAVNLRGTFIGCRIAGAHMRRNRRGRLINIASLAGQQPSAASGVHYAASKAGVLAVTRSFAAALAADGVTVNAVAASAIDGPALQALDAAQAAALIASIPLGRAGRPEELCAAVLFLASPEAAYITGTTLDVNGGRFMRP